MQKLTIFILILFSYSCFQKEVKEIVSYYDSGEPEIIVYYKNKSYSTTYRKEVFYKSGKLKQTGFFTQDLKDGEFIWYFQNGKKSGKVIYSKGVAIDTIIQWYENGRIKSKNVVLKGLNQNECESCNGTKYEFDSSGFLQQKYTVINGKLEGISIKYENNREWTISTYHNDTLNGLTIDYAVDENSKDTFVITRGQYLNNLEEGTWEFFNLKLKSKEIRIYKKGKQNGERKVFDKNGILRVKGLMTDDYMEGDLFHYDSLGNLKSVETFKKDKLIHKKSYDR